MAAFVDWFYFDVLQCLSLNFPPKTLGNFIQKQNYEKNLFGTIVYTLYTTERSVRNTCKFCVYKYTYITTREQMQNSSNKTYQNNKSYYIITQLTRKWICQGHLELQKENYSPSGQGQGISTDLSAYAIEGTQVKHAVLKFDTSKLD
jgi:hypothetical protein